MTHEVHMHAMQSDRDIGAFFDQCAQKRLMYEFDAAEQETLEHFRLRWGVQSGQRVLEPGCGNGRLTRILADATAPGGEVYACDLSAGMIALARERNLPPHVHLICGSAMNIDRPGEWFDHIICLNVFPHIADKRGALRELARVLKPDGCLWINHFKSRDELNEFHQQAAPAVSGHVLPCAQAIRYMVSEAGLDVISVEDRPGVYSVQAVKRTLAANEEQG